MRSSNAIVIGGNAWQKRRERLFIERERVGGIVLCRSERGLTVEHCSARDGCCFRLRKLFAASERVFEARCSFFELSLRTQSACELTNRVDSIDIKLSERCFTMCDRRTIERFSAHKILRVEAHARECEFCFRKLRVTHEPRFRAF